MDNTERRNRMFSSLSSLSISESGGNKDRLSQLIERRHVAIKKMKQLKMLDKKQRALLKLKQKMKSDIYQIVPFRCGHDEQDFVAFGHVECAVEALAASMSLHETKLLADRVGCVQNPKEKTWGIADKSSAAAYYLRSPKTYNLLRAIHALPSPRSIRCTLNCLPLKAGINQHIFDSLKKHFRSIGDDGYPFCTLMWGQIPLREHCDYSAREDIIVGFEDLPNGRRTANLADNVVVFMVKGTYAQWKQPLAFYFTSGRPKAELLVESIRAVLTKCFECGLVVAATVCDADIVNRNAYHLLGSSSSQPYFSHEGKKIVAMFDPPELIKRTRDVFCAHDITLPVKFDGASVETTELVASWNHLLKVYDLDQRKDHQLLDKVTDKHLHPSRKNPEVRYASQLLSYTAGVTIHHFESTEKGELPRDVYATREVCLFFDMLFDSFNGRKEESSDNLRCQDNSKRPKVDTLFWESAIEFIQTMKFHREKRTPPGEIPEAPSSHPAYFTPYIVAAWLRNLRGAQMLLADFKIRLPSMSSVKMRNFQLDTLKNLFAAVRHYAGSDTRQELTAFQFITSLKTAMLNGLNVWITSPLVDDEFVREIAEREPENVPLIDNLREYWPTEGQEKEELENFEYKDFASHCSKLFGDKIFNFF